MVSQKKSIYKIEEKKLFIIIFVDAKNYFFNLHSIFTL